MATEETKRTGHSERLYGADGVDDLIDRLAGEMMKDMAGQDETCLIGIQRRGDTLARRLSRHFEDNPDNEMPFGSLDITLYRDDFDSLAQQPIVGSTSLPFAVAGKTIYLIDDVLYTGRTIRAALDELSALGRPSRIILAVLIDRGGRELPISPDYVAETIPVKQGDEIQVRFVEDDGEDAVLLYRRV